MIKIRLIKYFFFLFICIPIFITINSDGSITFDRGIRVPKELINIYLVTIPVSFFLILFVSFLKIKNLSADINFIILMASLLLIFLINILFGINSSIITATWKIFFYFLSIFSLNYLFKNTVDIKKYLYLFNCNLIIITYIIIISNILFPTYHTNNEGITTIDNTHIFLSSKFIVYNYYQYFAFTALISLSISIHFKNIYFITASFISLAYLINSSLNNTAILITIFYFLFLLINFFTNNNKKLNILFLSSICFCPIIYLATIIFFPQVSEYLDPSFGVRISGLNNYFMNKMSIFDILSPLNDIEKTVNLSAHNELAFILSYGGILLYLFFFIFNFKLCLDLLKINFNFGILFSLIIFLSSLTIMPTFHPYIIIILACLYGLTINLNKKNA